jgi:hypothetical protein
MEQWAPDALADALRTVMARVSMEDDLYRTLDVAVDGTDVRLSLEIRDDGVTYVVLLSGQPPHIGESTGEPSRSPQDWATEVWIMLGESVGTLSYRSARRTTLTDGVVQLHL